MSMAEYHYSDYQMNMFIEETGLDFRNYFIFDMETQHVFWINDRLNVSFAHLKGDLVARELLNGNVLNQYYMNVNNCAKELHQYVSSDCPPVQYTPVKTLPFWIYPKGSFAKKEGEGWGKAQNQSNTVIQQQAAPGPIQKEIIVIRNKGEKKKNKPKKEKEEKKEEKGDSDEKDSGSDSDSGDSQDSRYIHATGRGRGRERRQRRRRRSGPDSRSDSDKSEDSSEERQPRVKIVIQAPKPEMPKNESSESEQEERAHRKREKRAGKKQTKKSKSERKNNKKKNDKKTCAIL